MAAILTHSNKVISVSAEQAAKIRQILDGEVEPETDKQARFVEQVKAIYYYKPTEVKAEPMRWVVGRATPNSDYGKSILAHVSQGLGYYILNPNRSRGDDLIFACLRSDNQQLPDHMQYANATQVEKLESLHSRRFGHVKGGQAT